MTRVGYSAPRLCERLNGPLRFRWRLGFPSATCPAPGVGVGRAGDHAAFVVGLRAGDGGEGVDQPKLAVDVAEGVRIGRFLAPAEAAEDVDDAHLLVDQVVAMRDVEQARRHP